MIRFRLKTAIVVVLVLATLSMSAGCGFYTFRPKGSSLYKTIAVERLENETAEFGLTDRLTDVIIDAFISDGTFRVVPADAAETILSGLLVRYERRPNRFDESDNVLEYKVVLEFDIALKKTADGTDIWKERLVQEGIYDAASETEEDGQERAGEQLVATVLSKTTKTW